MSARRCARCGGHCHEGRTHFDVQPPGTFTMEERSLVLGLPIARSYYHSATIRASLMHRDRHKVDPPRARVDDDPHKPLYEQWANVYTQEDFDLIDSALHRAAEQTKEAEQEAKQAQARALAAIAAEQARRAAEIQRANSCLWCSRPKDAHDDAACAAERAKAIEEHEAGRLSTTRLHFIVDGKRACCPSMAAEHGNSHVDWERTTCRACQRTNKWKDAKVGARRTQKLKEREERKS